MYLPKYLELYLNSLVRTLYNYLHTFVPYALIFTSLPINWQLFSFLDSFATVAREAIRNPKTEPKANKSFRRIMTVSVVHSLDLVEKGANCAYTYLVCRCSRGRCVRVNCFNTELTKMMPKVGIYIYELFKIATTSMRAQRAPF